MDRRTLFIALSLGLFFAGAVPAFADGETPLTRSDEEFMKNLNTTNGISPDAIKAAMDANDLMMSGEFVPQQEPEKAPVKYVYHGYSETTLRRTVKDDRIDDGYVQGLLLQRASD